MLLVSEEKDVCLAERMMPFVLCNHASLGAAWDWEVAEGRVLVPLCRQGSGMGQPTDCTSLMVLQGRKGVLGGYLV